MSETDRIAFLSIAPTILPEVGSRLMERTVHPAHQDLHRDWLVMQEGRFAYALEARGRSSTAKMIIRDYLAAEVVLSG